MIKILLLILLSSCSVQQNVDPFLESIFERWFTTYAIKLNLEVGKTILSPPNTWQVIAELDYLAESGEKRDCLYYKVPHRELTGILHYQLADKNSKCPEYPSDDQTLSKTSIKDLAIQLTNGEGTNEVGYLLLTFKENGKDRSYQIPLTNIVHSKSYELMKDAVAVRTFGKFQIRPAKIIALEKRLRDGEICRTDEFDRCHQCSGPFFEAIGLGSLRPIAICGKNRCGEKGKPACLRGEELNPQEQKAERCVHESKLGFCMPDLTTECSSDGVLICN